LIQNTKFIHCLARRFASYRQYQFRCFATSDELQIEHNNSEGLSTTNLSSLSKRSWAQGPFDPKMDLEVPVFNFATGEPLKDKIKLEHSIFNVPMRRDIIHNVFLYFENYGRKTFKRVKTVGDVSGSGIKPRPQKGSGRSRQGHKRAPNLRGGGAAHGAVPRDFTFPINNKVRLLALKSLLSAKLYEERILIVDSEKIEHPKTKILADIMSPFKEEKILLVTGLNVDGNFEKAAGNLQKLEHVKAQDLSVKNAIRAKFIVFTKDGLQLLNTILDNRRKNYYRLKKIPRPELEYDALVKIKKEDLIEKIKSSYTLDEGKDLQIYSSALHHFIEDKDKPIVEKAPVQKRKKWQKQRSK